jgi:hypothetical protein
MSERDTGLVWRHLEGMNPESISLKPCMSTGDHLSEWEDYANTTMIRGRATIRLLPMTATTLVSPRSTHTRLETLQALLIYHTYFINILPLFNYKVNSTLIA